MKLKYQFLFKRILYYFYGEKFFKRLPYDWSKCPSRIHIIQEIINLKKFSNYLEIGCDQDENFSQINIKNKIGVDPKSGGTHRMTSDNFFKNNTDKFDIIFLDGLHTYEQTIKDINNGIQSIQDNGIILIHDCLPKKIWNQIVPRIYGHWNGDVWKAIVEFRTYKNLDIYTCYADHGIGVIFVRPNKNQLSLDKKNFLDLRFKDYFENYNKYMNLISYSELIKLVKEN